MPPPVEMHTEELIDTKFAAPEFSTPDLSTPEFSTPEFSNQDLSSQDLSSQDLSSQDFNFEQSPGPEGANPPGARLFELPGARQRQRQLTAVRVRGILAGCEYFADFSTICLGVVLSCRILGAIRPGTLYGARPLWAGAVVIALVMVVMLDRQGAYRRGNSLLRVRETEMVLRACAQALLVGWVANLLGGSPLPSLFLVASAILTALLLFSQKMLLFLAMRRLHQRGIGNERALIYGAGRTGRRLFSALRGSPSLGLEPVAIVDDDAAKTGSHLPEMAYFRRSSSPVLGGPLTRDMVKELRADLVVIAIPSIGREKFMNAVEEVLAAGARVSFVPSPLMSSETWLDYRDLDGILLASLARPSSRRIYEFGKRSCDLALSSLLLVLHLPVILALTLLIKLDSPGPVLFRQERVGRLGRRFTMLKFRTMHISAPRYDFSPRDAGDPRITRTGRFLRRTSLDELPQLLNVLAGSMALVGPRPEMPFIVESYTATQRLRLQVKPGVTGLWQLSGDRGFLIHENIEYDFYYIQYRNFFLDLAVLLHTAAFAMRGV
jgi:exopolysaccharide biosynthesis polyprenyl glycosylphosphotransferase